MLWEANRNAYRVGLLPLSSLARGCLQRGVAWLGFASLDVRLRTKRFRTTIYNRANDFLNMIPSWMNVSMVVSIEDVRRRFHQQSRLVDLRSARGAFTHVLKEIVKFYGKYAI